MSLRSVERIFCFGFSFGPRAIERIELELELHGMIDHTLVDYAQAEQKQLGIADRLLYLLSLFDDLGRQFTLALVHLACLAKYR